MRSYLFESITEPRNYLNWGIFVVLVPDEIEWSWHSHVKTSMDPVLAEWGWTPEHIMILDVQTGEAAMFRPSSDQKEWLDEHRIWVSPQFKPFLAWIAQQDIATLYQAPGVIELPDATFALRGWRELGPHPVTLTLHQGDVINLQWGGETHPVVCDEVGPEGAVIRSLSRAEARVLMGVPDEDVEKTEDETHELDYEEMREGLPPPGAPEDAVASFPAITEDQTVRLLTEAETAAIEAPQGRTRRRGRNTGSPNVTVLSTDGQPTETIPAITADSTDTGVIPAVTDGPPGDNAGSASPS